ncbi:MAG: helix-turn-helix transcriptional regulator [Oscillospiraceae bacterium]|nr:helix-turn-helix transcriptional regulator [Oscillospiraceae bacterium]
MFYDNYVKCCNNVKKSPSAVAVELGLSRASVSGWKNGKIPTDANISKMADYFGVTSDYLLGNEQKEKPLVNDDEELNEYLEELKNRPEMKMLFSLAKGATKKDVEDAVAIIEALRRRSEE